jgi:hypothetical protein
MVVGPAEGRVIARMPFVPAQRRGEGPGAVSVDGQTMRQWIVLGRVRSGRRMDTGSANCAIQLSNSFAKSSIQKRKPETA